jgi:NAD(P)H dehydrogenase (quinone)
MIKPKILVTGAAGKTGAAVVRELIKQGWPVRAAIRQPDARSKALEALGAETVVTDFFDPEQLLAAMRGVTRVYYLPIMHPFMIQGAVAFAEAARQAKIEHIVQMSQWLSSPRHPSLLTRQLWLVDRLLSAIPGTAHTIMNPGMFADNFLRLIDFASLLGVYPHLTGQSKSAPISNEDLARTAVALLSSPEKHAGKSYRPTGPKLLSSSDIAQIMGRVLSKKVWPVPIQLWMFTKTARMQGVNAFEVSGWRYYVQDHRLGAFEYEGGVNDVVDQLTGQPAESFEATAARYAALPFAQPTLVNRIKAFANFNRTPFSPGWDLDKFDRAHDFPVPQRPELASQSSTWKASHSAAQSATLSARPD